MIGLLIVVVTVLVLATGLPIAFGLGAVAGEQLAVKSQCLQPWVFGVALAQRGALVQIGEGLELCAQFFK